MCALQSTERVRTAVAKPYRHVSHSYVFRSTVRMENRRTLKFKSKVNCAFMRYASRNCTLPATQLHLLPPLLFIVTEHRLWHRASRSGNMVRETYFLHCRTPVKEA